MADLPLDAKTHGPDDKVNRIVFTDDEGLNDILTNGLKLTPAHDLLNNDSLKGLHAFHHGDPEEWLPVLRRDYGHTLPAHALEIDTDGMEEVDDPDPVDRNSVPHSGVMLTHHAIIPPERIRHIGTELHDDNIDYEAVAHEMGYGSPTGDVGGYDGSFGDEEPEESYNVPKFPEWKMKAGWETEWPGKALQKGRAARPLASPRKAPLPHSWHPKALKTFQQYGKQNPVLQRQLADSIKQIKQNPESGKMWNNHPVRTVRVGDGAHWRLVYATTPHVPDQHAEKIREVRVVHIGHKDESAGIKANMVGALAQSPTWIPGGDDDLSL